MIVWPLDYTYNGIWLGRTGNLLYTHGCDICDADLASSVVGLSFHRTAHIDGDRAMLVCQYCLLRQDWIRWL